MNIFQKIARQIVRGSFEFSISVIETFSQMNYYHKKVEDLGKLKAGTIGKELADLLEKHNLTFIPKYESHDLKHIILNYEMTVEGEIRMQAFMLGNGNYGLPTIVILAFGLFMLP